MSLNSFLFLSLLFCSNLLFSQTDQMNHEKYKIYRDRLKTDFMLYSEDNIQGSNIPASIIDSQKKQIRWGDATINLSFYIATLATEYRLHKENNEDVKKSFQDLYFAMQTLERLDMTAEAFYDSHIGLSYPNGFFIRDDIPVNLKKKLPENMISQLWTKHISEAADKKRDFFIMEATKRKLFNPEKLFDDYKKALLAA